MGTQLPLPKKGTQPLISAHVYFCQTAGWIKMPLNMEVGLGPGHIVLDGDPAPPAKKGHSPHFSAHVYCVQMAGWIKMPLGTKVGFGPGHTVLHGDPAPSPPQKKGHTPNFRPMSSVAKRSPILATAEHLLWPPYGIGQAIIFLPCGFFLYLLSFLLA